ncbi:MAG: hypothetical protein V1900_02640 [Candidatus Aenigmatarchaeota archaeon]
MKRKSRSVHKRRKVQPKVQKVKSSWILAIFIIVALSLIYYYNLQKLPSTPLNINEIWSNLNEYNNPRYFNSLTQEQRNQIANDLDRLFDDCNSKKNCAVPFLFVYMQMKANLGFEPFEIMRDRTDAIMSAYNNLPSTLTENDLKGFYIPFITKLCRFGMLDRTSELSWANKIMGVEKTKWESTYMQIYYFVDCMHANNISDLSTNSGIPMEELNSKVCNILPSIQDMNQKDLCEVFDYMLAKRFCLAEITAEESAVAESLLSNEYNFIYQIGCKAKLTRIMQNTEVA